MGGVFNINGELEGLALAVSLISAASKKGLLLAPDQCSRRTRWIRIGIIKLSATASMTLHRLPVTSQSLYALEVGTDKFYTLV